MLCHPLLRCSIKPTIARTRFLFRALTLAVTWWQARHLASEAYIILWHNCNFCDRMSLLSQFCNFPNFSLLRLHFFFLFGNRHTSVLEIIFTRLKIKGMKLEWKFVSSVLYFHILHFALSVSRKGVTLTSFCTLI